MPADPQNIAADLVAFRRQHRLTQGQAAEALGVSKRTLEAWEGGRPCSVAGLVSRVIMLLPQPQPEKEPASCS